MARSTGSRQVRIALIDGPIVADHPDLSQTSIEPVSRSGHVTCSVIGSAACLHATFVAGILIGKRGSAAPAICPDCTLLVRPIFAEVARGGHSPLTSTSPSSLSEALIQCMNAGANIINLSLALQMPAPREQHELAEALNQAARRGVIVVAAAGNQGAIASSIITRHPWVIPVAACDLHGRPMNTSNLGGSIGRRGLSAPGDNIVSLGVEGSSSTFTGTSVATPFVTGAIALLWSQFPAATSAEIRLAISRATARRTSIIPPLLNVAAASRTLLESGAN